MDPQHARRLVFISFLLAAIALGSCQSQKDRDRAQALQRQTDSLRAAVDSIRKEFNLRVHRSANMLSDMRTGLWRVDTLSETGRLVFAIEYPNASVYEIAKALNATFRADSVSQFKITGIREHIAFVKILDGEQLTQGIGSTGAKEYLAQVTLSLTSVPGIRKVCFDFEEGDHASPGTYARKDFVEMLK